MSDRSTGVVRFGPLTRLMVREWEKPGHGSLLKPSGERDAMCSWALSSTASDPGALGAVTATTKCLCALLRELSDMKRAGLGNDAGGKDAKPQDDSGGFIKSFASGVPEGSKVNPFTGLPDSSRLKVVMLGSNRYALVDIGMLEVVGSMLTEFQPGSITEARRTYLRGVVARPQPASGSQGYYVVEAHSGIPSNYDELGRIVVRESLASRGRGLGVPGNDGPVRGIDIFVYDLDESPEERGVLLEACERGDAEAIRIWERLYHPFCRVVNASSLSEHDRLHPRVLRGGE